VLAVLLLNADPYDSPYDGLAGGHAARLVTLLCILLREKTTNHLGGGRALSLFRFADRILTIEGLSDNLLSHANYNVI
jgi:hypothetical protein